MAKGWKIFAAIAAVGAAAAAILALKKRKEMEDYDYEELDDDFDDCDCCCGETDEDCTVDDAVAEETVVTEDVEEDLDNIQESVEEIDK